MSSSSDLKYKILKLNIMTLEQYKKLQEAGAHEALWLELLNASGFASVLPNGNIVDRRYFPEATPVEKNSIFGTSKPKTNEELRNTK